MTTCIWINKIANLTNPDNFKPSFSTSRILGRCVLLIHACSSDCHLYLIYYAF
jgi:hypothetical protein